MSTLHCKNGTETKYNEKTTTVNESLTAVKLVVCSSIGISPLMDNKHSIVFSMCPLFASKTAHTTSLSTLLLNIVCIVVTAVSYGTAIVQKQKKSRKEKHCCRRKSEFRRNKWKTKSKIQNQPTFLFHVETSARSHASYSDQKL
jgi:hypothetical protein